MLEGYFLDLAWLLGALFFGVMLGSLTGLIPGFHVNNVALILLALSPALLDLGIPLASVAAIIVSTGTVHTFLNYIPSALIGAPDGDTALSLFPGIACSFRATLHAVWLGLHVALNSVSSSPFLSSSWLASPLDQNSVGTTTCAQSFPLCC